MKKVYIIFICFIFSYSQSIAQPYESIFGDSITSWSIYMVGIDFGDTDSFTTTFDTTFNNFNYKYVQKHGINIGYNGIIREDANQGKAWFIADYTGATEELIMDLNLNVGDTFYTNNFGNIVVDSVYYINNKKYIQFNLMISAYDMNNNIGSKPFTFIEGIGANAGILYQTFYSLQDNYLLCASKDSVRTYSDDYFNGTCYVNWVGINEMENSVKWNIAPQPFNNFTVVSMENNSDIISKIEIYDIHGRIVENMNNINSNKVEIYKNELKNGIYFFQLTTVNMKVAKGKLIIN